MLSKRKILLVEDSADDIELTLRAFKKNNIMNKIIVKCDGEKALDFFFGKNGIADKRNICLPILILLDLKLPKIDGFEVLKKLKAHKRTRMIPVVMLTSSKEPHDIANSYKLGCNSYIHKAVDFNDFTNTVKQLAIYWLGINEIPPKENYLLN